MNNHDNVVMRIVVELEWAGVRRVFFPRWSELFQSLVLLDCYLRGRTTTEAETAATRELIMAAPALPHALG